MLAARRAARAPRRRTGGPAPWWARALVVGAFAWPGVGPAFAQAGVPAQAPAGTAPARGRMVTDTLWSQALAARKSLVLYLPPSYASQPARRFPVAYYLHGADGDETNWTRLGRMAETMDSLVAAGMPEMIVAMPDGDDSWYATYNLLLTDAGCRALLRQGKDPVADCVAWPHYDDYIAFDVVRFVDTRYRTFAARDRRAIAGLSMGGYGAFTLALQYPGTFAAAASHSGVLWPLEMAPRAIGGGALPRATADSATMARFVAANAARFHAIFGADSASWQARDPMTLARRLKARGAPLPALRADCGATDVFLPQNRAFRDAAAAGGVPLEYREFPGGHTWAYWRAHVGESLRWIADRIALAPR